MRNEEIEEQKELDLIIQKKEKMKKYKEEWEYKINDKKRKLENIELKVEMNMQEKKEIEINCGYKEKGMKIGLKILGKSLDDMGVLSIEKD